ncbi:flagellar motor protein MotA [Coralliovum pocilloporae]|uniref:flagellar motor protein MotA n=1 Tax=Coralliovum pocilloporae TaxID=3066369 RepID=UPI003306D52B
MADELDPYKLSSPQIYLWRMVIFLIIAAFVPFILYRQVLDAFNANVFLNGVILAVLFFGVILAFRQVILLFPEVRWVNGYRVSDEGISMEAHPTLLAPMATMLRDRQSQMAMSPTTMRSILDSIGTRLDEARDISRYLTGLLVFLGLLGTFWGLLQTIGAVGNTIQSLDVGSGDAGVIFEDLKTGLEAPLSGMGIAFASSLFGLAGSLVLGFLDLQAGAAQNRFYTDLEDWLSSLTDLHPEAFAGIAAEQAEDIEDRLQAALDRLSHSLDNGGNARTTTAAMANLAEGIQGLVQHMRNEQQMIRTWVEKQGEQQEDIRRLLQLLTSHKPSDNPNKEG